MNNCIICNDDSGFSMICPDCKEAFLHYKSVYFINKKLNETTDLDSEVFSIVYESAGFDEIVDDPLFEETDIPNIMDHVKNLLQKDPNAVWLTRKEGRMDNFLKYSEDRLRKSLKEEDNEH